MRSIRTFKPVWVAGCLAGAMLFTSGQAFAVSSAVQYACMSDYFTFCSQHAPDSQATRTCMKNAGSKLSKSCVNALAAAGEVPREVADRRATRKGR